MQTIFKGFFSTLLFTVLSLGQIAHARNLSRPSREPLRAFAAAASETWEVRGFTTRQPFALASLHSLAQRVCPFFEELYFSEVVRTESDYRRALSQLDPSLDREGFDSLTTHLGPLLGERDVSVYSGSAEGNNTSGTMFVVHDARNREIFFVTNTNCGSDD